MCSIMDIPHQDITHVLSLVCTDIGAAAGLPSIDITKWTGGDVGASCTNENVTAHNLRFGLSRETAHKNNMGEEKMYLYTNSCLLNREELFAYFMNAVESRGPQNGVAGLAEDEIHEHEPLVSYIREHKKKYIMHQNRNLQRANSRHAVRLQQNKDMLKGLLMPHKLSTRFLAEMHRNISKLLTLSVLEKSLYMIRNNIVTVPVVFNHTTQELFRLHYLNEVSVHVETSAKSICSEALNAFLPPHYACWDKGNPLCHSMQPLLDCYARTDLGNPVLELWHNTIKQAHTMQDYTGLLRVEDILTGMVSKGENMTPIPREIDHIMKNDVATLRFIVCVLFVIHIHNTSRGISNHPLFFTRLDNPNHIVFHSPSSMHLYSIAPGQVFCHGGYLYVRPPDMQQAGTVLRSKCILSLCLRLSERI